MIELHDIVYRVGSFELKVSLQVAAGEYCVLFGMSGCGKTSLLECVCGLREPVSGSVVIGGNDVTRLEPRLRGVGYVPQDGALFAHLSVRANIEFALKVKGVARGERRELVDRVAQDMRIAHLLERRIDGLSGGERQRLALCRAVVHSPQVLLLDEPVSALDECTRDAICCELVELQRSRGMAVLHVCHSFEESQLVADRVAVMQDGRIVQSGSPGELVQAPQTAYVAEIMRIGNVFDGPVERAGKTCKMALGDYLLPVPLAASAGGGIVIPPWKVKLGGDSPGDMVVVEGVVGRTVMVGGQVRIELAEPLPLVALVPLEDARGIHPQQRVKLAFNLDDVVGLQNLAG
jgi:ABC-type Fe3+/spermidine/putrescine transport system ATPase subunit